MEDTNLELSFDDIVNSNNNNSVYVPLVPPVDTNDDGSLYINDYVYDVTLDSLTFNEEKENRVEVVFEKEGATITKILFAPYNNSKFAEKNDDDKKKALIFGIRHISDLVEFFYKEKPYNDALAAMKEAGTPYTYDNVAKLAANYVKDKSNLRPDVKSALKITFQKDSDLKPRYNVNGNFRSNYLGRVTESGKSLPKWEEVGQWADKRKFTPINVQSDFGVASSTPSFELNVPDVTLDGGDALPFN